MGAATSRGRIHPKTSETAEPSHQERALETTDHGLRHGIVTVAGRPQVVGARMEILGPGEASTWHDSFSLTPLDWQHRLESELAELLIEAIRVVNASSSGKKIKYRTTEGKKVKLDKVDRPGARETTDLHWLTDHFEQNARHYAKTLRLQSDYIERTCSALRRQQNSGPEVYSATPSASCPEACSPTPGTSGARMLAVAADRGSRRYTAGSLQMAVKLGEAVNNGLQMAGTLNQATERTAIHLQNLKTLDTLFDEWCALERDTEDTRRVYSVLPKESRRQVALDTLDKLREEVERSQGDDAKILQSTISISVTARFGLKLEL